MKLQYHQATFDLIGKDATFSDEASADIDRLERQFEIHLPASLREWYSIENIADIFFTFTNDSACVPVRLAKLRIENFGVKNASAGKYGGTAFIKILYDAQAGCRWAIILDGSDDPSVLFDCDGDPANWKSVALSFSSWCFSTVKFWFDDPNELWSEHERKKILKNPPLLESFEAWLSETAAKGKQK